MRECDEMAIPKHILATEGNWTGDSRLHLSWLPDEADRIKASASTLTVEADANRKYVTVSYTWEYEGETQFGRMLVAGDRDGETLEAGWSDSWHQSGGVLHLTATSFEENPAKLNGKYPAGDGTFWGWRIEIETDDDTLILRMFNVMPDGPEEWAVEGIYKRA